ncbi:unnamed protein product, partial [marine sediment metagenome]
VFNKTTYLWSSEYTIQSVNKTAHTITLQESISANDEDFVHAIGMNVGDIVAGNSSPFWARGVSFLDTVKEEKFQYLRARETVV